MTALEKMSPAVNEYIRTDESTFYNNMKSVLFTLRLMGLLPYHITQQGRMEFSYFSPAAIYSLLVMVTVTVGVIYRGMLAMEDIYSVSFVSRMFAYISLVVYCSPVILIPLVHWTETRKKIEYINNWSCFQYEFRRVTGKLYHLRLHYKVLLGLAAVMAYVGLQCIPFILNIATAHLWWALPTMLFCTFFHMLIAIPWVSFCSSLRIAGKSMRMEMEAHVGTCGFGNGSKISEYRVLWLQLSRLTQDLGNSMGMTFGAHIVVYFTGQVLFMYYILSMLSLRLDEFIVKFLIPVAISIYIYIVCNAAQSVTDEIGESFLECLEMLETKHPPKNAESDNEIQKFLNTMERNPPVISFCGFANVNRSLQTSLMSALVTYMIVLLQFNMGSPNPLCASNVS